VRHGTMDCEPISIHKSPRTGSGSVRAQRTGRKPRASSGRYPRGDCMCRYP
jgi:hypothetical protein